MCYWAIGNLYQAMEHVLQGSWVTRPWFILYMGTFYWTVGHEFQGPGPYCTRSIILSHWSYVTGLSFFSSMKHELTSLEDIVQCHWPCCTGLWIKCYQALDMFCLARFTSYWALDHILPGIDHEFPGCSPCAIGKWTMCYQEVGHVLLGYGSCANGICPFLTML